MVAFGTGDVGELCYELILWAVPEPDSATLADYQQDIP